MTYYTCQFKSREFEKLQNSLMLGMFHVIMQFDHICDPFLIIKKKKTPIINSGLSMQLLLQGDFKNSSSKNQTYLVHPNLHSFQIENITKNVLLAKEVVGHTFENSKIKRGYVGLKLDSSQRIETGKSSISLSIYFGK